MSYTRHIKCPMKGCKGTVEAFWKNSKEGFQRARCPNCKQLFEPYLQSRLRLMEVDELEEKE